MSTKGSWNRGRSNEERKNFQDGWDRIFGGKSEDPETPQQQGVSTGQTGQDTDSSSSDC